MYCVTNSTLLSYTVLLRDNKLWSTTFWYQEKYHLNYWDDSSSLLLNLKSEFPGLVSFQDIAFT